MMRIATIFMVIMLAGATSQTSAGWAYTGYPGYDHDENSLQIRVLDDQVVAVRNRLPDASVQLGVSEQVLAVRSEGLVAGVLTDSRFLAISADSQDWRQQPLEIDEGYSGSIRLSENLVLLLTQQRSVVFDGRKDLMAEYDLPLGEDVIDKKVGYQVAAFVTMQRAVAYGEGSQDFSALAFDPDETFRYLSISYGVVTVLTSERLLTFESATGSWTARPRSELDDRLQQW